MHACMYVRVHLRMYLCMCVCVCRLVNTPQSSCAEVVSGTQKGTLYRLAPDDRLDMLAIVGAGHENLKEFHSAACAVFHNNGSVSTG